MIVLGIEATGGLQKRWREWLAPEPQPFFVESLRSWPRGRVGQQLTAELAHTYATWRVDRSLQILWLDEAGFAAMPSPERSALLRAQLQYRRGALPPVRRWSDLLDPAVLRSQSSSSRFVWWPSLVSIKPGDILSRVIAAAPEGVEALALPSRHGEVARATWRRCSGPLPEARRLAGAFPWSSGPNCFGTVMGAAGVAGAENELVVGASFLGWVDSACRPGGRDSDPGTVLVWRDGAGLPVHAAVTIGDGWALEKASGEWWTPRAVRAVDDVIRTRRTKGQHLERHHTVCG